ncbi:MAG: integral rane sensor signal transduction histidine kinase [Firmicutes bacterium]|nr:integral rane sensor signal transduction histidine kinase [Bacillota bacterium]
MSRRYTGLAINSSVVPMNNSITYRITGLTFLVVAVTVFLLIYLANVQMTEQFKEYLVVQQMEMSHGGRLMYGDGSPDAAMIIMMGPQEQTFLTTVHNSLIWVGMAILAVGLAASYILARSITVPLRKLSQAAEQIERGNFNLTVPVEKNDEVGHLAAIFNRMADALATNNNLRRQFLANIAHELKTPLAIIQGHLEGMIDGVIEPSKEQFSSLYEEAVRLNRLIRDLRDLSLAEVRQLALEKHPTDINWLIGRSLTMLKPLADEKDLEFTCRLAENVPEIMVDSDRMSQVFYNIIVNAIRYSPVNGRIMVTTEITERETKPWIKIAVTDNGPGIAAEDVPYVFDHFYRGDKSRDRKSGGTGLGLAIVKQLVEIHGGQVTVDSELGKGCVFQVLVPFEQEKLP